jgi:hypothetical protein
VLVDHPRFKRRVKDRGGDAAQKAAQHQDGVAVEVLGEAAYRVEEHKQQAVRFAPILVRKAADHGAE